MNSTTTRRQPIALFELETANSYSAEHAHPHLRFGYFDPEAPTTPRNFGDSAYEDGHEYAHLDVSAQGENSRREAGLYGFDAEYRSPYTVNLRQAEGMVKLLRTLSRKLAQMNEQEGYVTDYPEYASRVCRALGVRTIVFRWGPQPRGFGYGQSEWRKRDLANGIALIRTILTEWQNGATAAALEALTSDPVEQEETAAVA